MCVCVPQHLVPGFRENPVCTNSVLRLAKQVVDRFDYVIDLEDVHDESKQLMAEALGLDIEVQKVLHARDSCGVPERTADETARFREMNECDHACDSQAHKCENVPAVIITASLVCMAML